MSFSDLVFIATEIRAPSTLPKATGGSDDIQTILDIIFSISGALALLVIVVSGLRYILAGGDPQKISKAKNGIVYALLGLVVVIIARSIVAFVLDRL